MPVGDRHQQQRSKNIALMLVLLAFVVIVFAVTYVRFTP